MSLSKQVPSVHATIAAVLINFFLVVGITYLFMGDLCLSLLSTATIILLQTGIGMAILHLPRPSAPPGLKYYPILGWLRRGWWGRFILEPDNPFSIGTRVTVHRPGRCMVILEIMSEKEAVAGRVLGYWTDDAWYNLWLPPRWHFRANRPLQPRTKQVAALLRFKGQRFYLRERSGEEVLLRIEGTCLPGEVREKYPDAEVV